MGMTEAEDYDATSTQESLYIKCQNVEVKSAFIVLMGSERSQWAQHLSSSRFSQYDVTQI